MSFAVGHTPWNKGLKGVANNDLFIRNNPSGGGSKNPNWKGGISIIGNCLDCGVKLKSYPAKYCLPCSMNHRKHKDNSGENHYRWSGGRPRCLECGKEIEYKAVRCKSCSKLGDRNRSWNGGASFLPYPVLFNRSLKQKVRERDNFTCLICGKSEKSLKRELDVHHIDYDKDNCNLNNLISLCSHCHARTNYNRRSWIKFFSRKNLI